MMHRVLHVIDSLPDFGGAPRELEAEALRHSSVQHSFACLHQVGDIGKRLREAGVRVDLFARHRLSVRLPFVLAAHIRRHAFEVVCCHFCRAGIHGRLAAAIAGVPSVMFEHGTTRRESLPFRWADRLLARRTSRVIANSRATAQHLSFVLKLTPDSLRVASPTVNFSPLPRRIRTGGRIRIGTVGGLNRCKGHEHLLRAFAAVLAAGHDCELEIAGDGDLRTHLGALSSELGIANRVCMPGYRSDVAEFLAGLDLFVFPSVSEGFGIAVVEAMLAGVPVIASDAGGLPEVVDDGQTGVLVPAGDHEKLARAICGLLADPARARQLAARAQAQAESLYVHCERTPIEEALLEVACLG